MYNIVNDPLMRDHDYDQTTGWIRNGRWYDVVPDLSTGVAGLGGLGDLGETVSRLPKLGQEHILEAMRDPEARPILVRLLRRPDAEDALATQAEMDVAEYVAPQGRPIVFKRFARIMGKKVKAAQEAVIAALPGKGTEDSEEAVRLARLTDDPKRAIQAYYEEIALEAMAPDAPEFLSEELAGYDDQADAFGLGASKRVKRRRRRLLKYGAIAVGVTAAAIGLYFAAPVILPALSTVGKVVAGTAGAMFAGKPKATTKQDPTWYDPKIPAGQPGGPPLVGPMPSPPETPSGAPGAAPGAFPFPGVSIPGGGVSEPSPAGGMAAPTETGATPGAPAAPVDLSWLGAAVVEIYKAKKGGAPPDRVAAMKQAQVARLVSIGVPEREAVAIVERAFAEVAKQDAATGGQLPGVSADEAEKNIMQAGMGTGLPSWLPLLGLGLLVAGGAGGKGGGRRRARRNPARRRRTAYRAA